MEKIAVRCETEKEYYDVQTKAFGVVKSKSFHSHPVVGIHWEDRVEFTHDVDSEWFNKNDYTIISAAEYLNEGGKDVSEFKKGDRVECVDTGGMGSIIKGRIYTVNCIDSGGLIGLAENGEESTYWMVERFILAESATKTQTTKENNMELNSSIRTVFVDEDNAAFDLVEKVQRVFGGEIAEDFTGAMTLRNNKDEYLAEIKRLDDIETKRLKEEAKKEGK